MSINLSLTLILVNFTFLKLDDPSLSNRSQDIQKSHYSWKRIWYVPFHSLLFVSTSWNICYLLQFGDALVFDGFCFTLHTACGRWCFLFFFLFVIYSIGVSFHLFNGTTIRFTHTVCNRISSVLPPKLQLDLQFSRIQGRNSAAFFLNCNC